MGSAARCQSPGCHIVRYGLPRLTIALRFRGRGLGSRVPWKIEDKIETVEI